MLDLSDLVARWGKRHFKKPSAAVLKALPLRDEDREVLRTVGLPVGPPEALGLNFRWYDADIVHTPNALRLLFPPDVKKPKHFPKTGDRQLDKWVDLSAFVVIGEVRQQYAGPDATAQALVCLDGKSGKVLVYYHTDSAPGGSVIEVFGSDLPGYLRSWLAYKEWREKLDAEEERLRAERMARLRAIHQELGKELKAADPAGFAVKKIGLWEHRSRNLTEDLEDDEDADW